MSSGCIFCAAAVASTNSLDLGAVEIETRAAGERPVRVCGTRARAEERDNPDVSDAACHDAMSFRCEYSDIRIPKLASRVTIDVPP